MARARGAQVRAASCLAVAMGTGETPQLPPRGTEPSGAGTGVCDPPHAGTGVCDPPNAGTGVLVPSEDVSVSSPAGVGGIRGVAEPWASHGARGLAVLPPELPSLKPSSSAGLNPPHPSPGLTFPLQTRLAASPGNVPVTSVSLQIPPPRAPLRWSQVLGAEESQMLPARQALGAGASERSRATR
ncbi:S-adenosylmethionine synthase [Platysternon megacephalum]|uniref:S-adenosylmethionine synthase n=1 Tax=Platysternon megacephalum TaxID=55544 RepID=A0A4D9DPE1_9SAUR|nr:S-adenosylmethionine synthase [Platysternon megacephalum]